MIQAVFIDIDDTVMNSQREITENTKKVIKECEKEGIKIILTSGRSRLDTLKYQKEIGASPYIISSNGADAWDVEEEKEIYSEPISKQVVIKLLEYAKKNNCKISLNYNLELVMNQIFYPDEEDKKRTLEELTKLVEKENIVQCVMANKEIEEMVKFKEYLSKDIPEVKIENESKRLKDLNLKPSSHYYCDITSSSVSKGKAVRAMCEYLNVSKENIATIGDGENDISMFEETIHSVAMGNAIQKVKEKANIVTNTNDEEGVANFLKTILNKK